MGVASDRPITDPTSIKIGIEYPPDSIFKYRLRRQNAAQGVLHGNVSYIPNYAEYLDGEGCFVYYCGALQNPTTKEIVIDKGIDREYFKRKGYILDLPAPAFPSQTVAPADAIYAVNSVKRDLISILHFLATPELKWLLFPIPFIGKKNRVALLNKGLNLFNAKEDLFMNPFYMQDGYYCSIVKEIRIFLETLLIELGIESDLASRASEILGCMFEYDNAYRFRLLDLFTEASKEAMIANLPKELDRLLAILASRETVQGGGQQVVYRFSSGIKVLKYAWLIPSFRKALRKAIKAMDFGKCHLQESDLYHTVLYGDYNVGGLALDERIARYYIPYHGPDQNKWPPRIMANTI